LIEAVPAADLLSADDEERLRFIVESQEHCDHYLTPLAEPAGKAVLVAGAGAGTDVLWCLRQGAREVVGIDSLDQSATALERAVDRFGLRPTARFSILRLAIEDAAQLARRFDLVLSNNTFEHVGDLERAFRACAEVVEPGTGRIAVFTDPLFYSSAGAHLPAEPWEHLWAEPVALRRRLLETLPPGHPLHVLELADYEREISLNRMRVADFLQAIWKSDLAVVNLRLLRDRRAQDLPAYLGRLARAREQAHLAIPDLLVEGLGVELMRVDAGPVGVAPSSTEERVLGRWREQLEERYRALAEDHIKLEQRCGELAANTEWLQLLVEDTERRRCEQEAAARSVHQVLEAVKASWSFRLGRYLTAPARGVRALARRVRLTLHDR
jgi:SAM-dependent methyltransferase